MKLTSAAIRKRILLKLFTHRIWGGKHTDYDLVPRGFPKDQGQDVRKELDQLIREGFIVTKPAHYGLQVSLNVRRKAEIEQIVFGAGENR